MKIEYHSKLLTEFHPNEKYRWALSSPFSFSVDGQEYEVPTDFWTDFGSVPRIIWPIISPYDLGVGPVPHDFGYYTGYNTRKYWDEVLVACMEKDRIDRWKRVVASQAVYLIGGSVWGRYEKKRKGPRLYRIVATNKFTLLNGSLKKLDKIGGGILGERELHWKLQIESLTSNP